MPFTLPLDHESPSKKKCAEKQRRAEARKQMEIDLENDRKVGMQKVRDRYAPFRNLASKTFLPKHPRFEPRILFFLKTIFLVFGLFVFDIFIGEWSRYFVWVQLPDTKLFPYPTIEWPPLYWFDLTFGLALVAVSEELLSRAILCWLIERTEAGNILVL